MAKRMMAAAVAVGAAALSSLAWAHPGHGHDDANSGFFHAWGGADQTFAALALAAAIGLVAWTIAARGPRNPK